MGKIGFRHYQEQENSSKDTENGDKNVGKQRESSGKNMGTFDKEVKAFSETISSRYDTTGICTFSCVHKGFGITIFKLYLKFRSGAFVVRRGRFFSPTHQPSQLCNT